MIELRIDENLVRRMTSVVQHIEKGAEVTATRAIRKTLSSLRTEATRLARRAYTARPQKLFAEISMTHGKDSAGRWGKLSIRDRRGISLVHFLPSPNGLGKRPQSGVSSKVRHSGRRYVHGLGENHGKPFIMRKNQGGFGLFVRRKGGDRTDLTMLYGPSPIQSLQRRESREGLTEKGMELFVRYMTHEVEVLAAGIVSAGGGR